MEKQRIHRTWRLDLNYCVYYTFPSYYKFVVKLAPSALNWPDHVCWDKEINWVINPQ